MEITWNKAGVKCRYAAEASNSACSGRRHRRQLYVLVRNFWNARHFRRLCAHQRHVLDGRVGRPKPLVCFSLALVVSGRRCRGRAAAAVSAGNLRIWLTRLIFTIINKRNVAFKFVNKNIIRVRKEEDLWSTDQKDCDQ